MMLKLYWHKEQPLPLGWENQLGRSTHQSPQSSGSSRNIFKRLGRSGRSGRSHGNQAFKKKNVCLRSHFHWSIVTDYRISNWRSSALMYIKAEILSIYLSLDLIMKAEEPMVFYDHLIFSLVFSKLQGSSQNDNAQLRTGTSRKIGIMIIWMLFCIVKSYCLCCCEVFGPQLFFDFTSGL